MLQPSIFALLLVSWAAAAQAAQEVLYTFSNLSATYYYDYQRWSHVQCAKYSGGPHWSDATSAAHTACGASADQLHSDAIVALNVTWMNLNGVGFRSEQLCGREVQLFNNDGTRVPTKQTLFLWDACQACSSLPRVDLSVDAYTQVTGDKDCERGHVGPFEVRVMDNFVRRSAASSLRPAVGSLATAMVAGVVALVI